MIWHQINQTIEKIANSLRTNSNQVTFSAHWGTQGMAITPFMLAFPLDAIKIKVDAASLIADIEYERFEMILSILDILMSTHIPNLHNNVSTHQVIFETFVLVDSYLTDLIGSEGNAKILGFPKTLIARAKSASAHLDNALENLEDIEKKIETIKEAHKSALDLPLTLKDIDEARVRLNTALVHFSTQSVELEKIMNNASSAVEKIKTQSAHADDLAGRIDGSYRAVTSQGLAQAFHDKEQALRTSTYVWTGFLFSSLVCMAGIGYLRFPEILASLSETPKWGVVLLELALAALSLGAPTWFAIVSTRQIGQRFKLAEDYGYKAAISAAYEGYRSEAQRFGDDFQSRLFSSTLDRLDEQPLRFIDHEVGGSPIQEIFNSIAKMIDLKAAKEFADELPSLIERWKLSSSKDSKKENPDGRE